MRSRATADAQEHVPHAALLAEARALLEQRATLIEAKDQKRLDVWRLSVGRLIDALVAQ